MIKTIPFSQPVLSWVENRIEKIPNMLTIVSLPKDSRSIFEFYAGKLDTEAW